MPKIIDLTAIESFFLTISDSKAKQMVEKVGNRLPLLKRVDGIRYKDHVSGCAIGHFKILREMLQRSGDFSPFFILEDDAWIDESAIESKNLQITVPSDTDGIYLGVSACANNMKVMYYHSRAKVKVASCESNDYWRVLNMLSTHAILYLTRQYAVDHLIAITQLLAARNVSPTFFPGGHDCFVSQLQLKYKVYAMKKPLFYQSIEANGQQSVTKITLDETIVEKVENENELLKEKEEKFYFLFDFIDQL